MKYEIKDLDQLNTFASHLAKLLKPGDVVSLIGDLGAGKTSLVQFIGKELGVKDYITSPTFAIINIYDGDIEINHLDLYRLEDPDELLQLDYEDYFYPEGISFIEWASMGGDYLPEDMIEVQIDYKDQGRQIEILGQSPRAQEIREGLDESFGR